MMSPIIIIDVTSPIATDLKVLCNFTDTAAIQNHDWLYNSMDNDSNQEKTSGKGAKSGLLKVERLDVTGGQRACLTTQHDSSGGDSAYIDKRCKFITECEYPFSISFWFMIRERSRYIQSPLMLIFGHGAKNFLALYFNLDPSGKFSLSLSFDDQDERTPIEREHRDHTRRSAHMEYLPEEMYSSRQRVEMKIDPGSDLIQTNKWYHTVALFSMKKDQSNVQFYLNGRKTNEIMRKVLKIDTDRTVLLRNHFQGGCLSDVAIWSRELTPTEIELLYIQSNIQSM